MGGGPSIYHCISRIVGGEWYLDNRAKEVLRRQIGRVSTFCGVEILTGCIMSNHFHLLVRIPEYGEVTDEELVKRFSGLHGEGDVRENIWAGKKWILRILKPDKSPRIRTGVRNRGSVTRIGEIKNGIYF